MQKIIRHWWKKSGDLNRWRDIPCSWVGRIKIMKLTILPNAIYRFNTIPIKWPMAFCTELEQTNFQFVRKHKRPQTAKTILWEKKISWKNQAPWLQTILQSYSNQNSMVLGTCMVLWISLTVQWLRFHTSTAGHTGSILD